MLPERIGGRYRVLRELGRGGMGVVYLVQEDGSPFPVALKVLSTREFSESALRHFEQEFRTLTSLAHPNLTEVYDFGRTSQAEDPAQQVPFFTMEFVDGETLDRHFKRVGPDFPRLYACLAQVGQALGYLHSRGLVHQDVKPSNILIRAGSEGSPQVKLMDLGLTGRPRASGAPGSIRGTVAYLPPEAVRGETPDPRSDLYSLGCVIYEVVTGRTPFQGTSALSVLRGHLQEDPLPPSALNRSIPADLEALVVKLLAKDRGLRPPTADRFLHALNQVAGGGLAIATAEIRRHRVLGGGFVGREVELARLAGHLDEARRGAGRLVLLVGDAGRGKSRLLREFQVRCQLDGVDVFLGRGDPHAGRGSLADALARAVRARGPLSADLLRRHAAVLDALAGPIPGSDAGAALEDEGHRAGDDPFRRLAAVTDLLEELGGKGPFVLAFDDLHAEDETSCALLAQMARSLGSAARGAPQASPPVLLLGAYRGEEISRASPIFELLAGAREEGVLEEVFLDPLGPEEVATMVRAMLGTEEVTPSFLQRILEETRGNPLYLSELMALLAEEGYLEPGASGTLDGALLSRVELPRRTRDLLERRLARIDAEPLLVLQAAAALGATALDPDAVAGITGMRWEHVVRQLIELQRAGAVVRDEDEDEPVYRLAHPGLAGLAAEATPPEEARRLHARAVAYLERRGLPRAHAAWTAFARHAEAAGQPGRAAEAFARAGDLAGSLYANREALESYGRAIELLVQQPAASTSVLCSLFGRRGKLHERLGDLQRAEEDYRWMLARAEKGGSDLLEGRAQLALGHVLAVRSQYAEAQESLEVALEIAGRLKDAALAAESEIRLGELYVQLGRFDEGVEHLDRGRQAARKADSLSFEVDALLAKGSLYRDQGNTRLSLGCFEEAAARTGGRAPAAVEEAIQEGQALALEVQGKHREALEAFTRARDRARDRGDVRAVASLTAHLGAVHARVGEVEAARQEFEQALAIQKRLGAKEGTVSNLQSLASLHVHRGRYESALETAEDALKLARRIGKKDLVAASLNLMGRIHLRTGDREKAGSCLEEAQRILRDLRSPRGLATFLLDLGELRRLEGNPAEARRHAQEAAFLARKIGDRRLESASLSRLGEAHLQENEYDRAQVACRKALALVGGAGLPREESDGRLLRARLELTRPGGDVVRAELDAIEAARVYRELLEPEQLWQAEHLAGKAASRLGRRVEATARLERAHRYLESVRTRLGERWRATFHSDPRRRELYDDWERLGPGASAPAAEQEPTAAEEVLTLRREAAALLRLLEINRTLNSARGVDELLGAILEAALELTGAERGFLLLRTADAGDALIARHTRGADGEPLEGASLELSRSIAQHTLVSGTPLLSTDAMGDDRLSGSESVHDLRIRSVLAVPLRIKDEVEGALYLDSRIDRAEFTPTHLHLASRLADQAAIALETARLVGQLEEQRARAERLNQELERTVQSQQSELESVREELLSTRSSIEMRYRYASLVGASPAMQRVYHLIERVAGKKLPVLVTGESGTGKELVARALHAGSDRSTGPFFTVNCAALTETLLESELFGYRKGAFTGADRDKPGYFALADKGTLFLDEIGEMGAPMQAKLLRAIEEGEVLPVGGKSPIHVDVRIVSATNRDLETMIREGTFREDLYYRINVARIRIPALRERRDDVPLLVDHFLVLLAEEEGQPKREIEPAVLKRLASCEWPGNVRELQHQILRVAAFARGTVLTLRDFERYGDLPPVGAVPVAAGAIQPGGDVDNLEALERKQILIALDRAGGNKTKAADLLGINRATLFRKLKRFEL